MINSDMWILIGIALFLILAFILGWALGKSKGYSKGFEENAKYSQCQTKCEECRYSEELSECFTDVYCKVFKTLIHKDGYCSTAIPKDN